MMRFVFFLVCLPVWVFSQEQVTNISHQAVYEPSYVNELVGFTEWDGEAYMFTEGDTLSMYRWKDTSWVLYNTIPRPKNRELCRFVEIPTRSKLLFKENMYCRTFRDYLQLIDIKSGAIISQHDLSTFQVKYQNPLGIYEENYFFYISNGGKKTYYRYDIGLDKLEELFVVGSNEKILFRENLLAGVSTQGNIMVYDAKLKKDTILDLNHNVGPLINYSVQDSTFNFTQGGTGGILKLNLQLQVSEYPCWSNEDFYYNPMYVYGEKVLALKSYVNQSPRQDSVLLYDLNECEVLYAFKTDTFGEYVKYIDVHESHDMPENTSIIGFYGFEPGDGIENIYYFINDREKKHVSSRNILKIAPFNSIEFNGDFYFVCSINGMIGNVAYLYKYNPISGAITLLDPEHEYDTHSIQLGIVKNDKLIFSSNSRNENPAIYAIDSLDSIEKTISLQFLKNVGVSQIKEVYTDFNDLYFKNPLGIYSMVDSGKLVILFDRNTDFLNNEIPPDVAVFGHKMAVAKHKTDTIIFEVFDVVTGTKDTIEKFLQGVSFSNKIVGPYIFFDNYYNGGFVHAYNFVTNTFYEYPDLSRPGYIYTIGQINASIDISDGGSLNNYVTHILDYETGTIKKTETNYAKNNIRMVSGHQGSFYLLDNDNSSSVKLLKKNGEVSSVFNTSGFLNYQRFSYQLDDGKTTVLILFTGNTCHIIANDLENTVVTTLPSKPKDVVLLKYKNSFLIETDSSGFKSYYLYEPYRELTLLKKTKDENVVLYDIRESQVALVLYKNDKTNHVLIYDRLSKSSENFELNGMPCLIPSRRGYMSHEPGKFVFDLDCNGENEPWVLDIKTQSLELLKDIIVGPSSSYPRNFTRHKEYVYFTAYIEELNRQWFRMDAKGDVSIVETPIGPFHNITIFPVPSDGIIHMNADLSSFHILNQEGKKIKEGLDYKQNHSLSIENLIPGIYYVIGTDENQKISVGKFLVVKN